MLIIHSPNNNTEEREYSIKMLFDNILGIKYELYFCKTQNYIMEIGNKKLVIHDAFFNNHPETLSYLNTTNIPSVNYENNSYCVENDIPILYGNGKIETTDDGITCGIDIFASLFFMLTRWEESVNTTRDKHGRFLGSQSIAYKNNFLNRPVVNEYAEMLWNMLKHIGYDGSRKERKFEIIPTHDVDTLFTKRLWYTNARSALNAIIKHMDFKSACSILNEINKDPLDCYSFLMDVSEKIGVKSHFYFMSVDLRIDKLDEKNYLQTKKFRQVIQQIVNRGHIVGFHPGYYTCRDAERWKQEKDTLEKTIGIQLTEGRQHYLMMEIPTTMSIWDSMNMNIDSTLCYADVEGFRCGTGDRFPYFDFLKRKQSNIIEQPLIVMDGTLRNYRNQSPEEATQTIKYYFQVGQKYKMPITILFHNSSFNKRNWVGWHRLYHNVMTDTLLNKY